MAEQREHDIVLFGATGFTGALTAAYLAANAPGGTKVALAGRHRQKLEGVRDEIGAALPLLHADVTEPASLRAVAESSHVVATTVGPYVFHGAPLVEACAAEGTDYLDITGEPEFVDRMYVEHHATAERTGARIVHACGFDSIPHDLGALFTVQQLPEGVPLDVRGYVRAGGKPSAGTFHSAIGAFSRVRQSNAAHSDRKKAEPGPAGGRRVRSSKTLAHRALGYWALP